jgi:hypothetical protein
MPPRPPGTVVRAAGSFKATDPDGRDLMILVFQEFTLTDNEIHGSRGAPGAKSMKLSTGHDVTKVGDGDYEVTSLGRKLTSIDPNRI